MIHHPEPTAKSRKYVTKTPVSVHKGNPSANPKAQTKKVIVVSQDFKTLYLIAIIPFMTVCQIASYNRKTDNFKSQLQVIFIILSLFIHTYLLS
jgi:hypothetical protein